PGVDLVLGMEQKGDVLKYIEERLVQKRSLEGVDACHEAISVPTKDIRTFVPSCSRGDRTRYFLKVQDGCNYYCTYCTIPIARGRSRNGSISSLVKQAEQVAAEGGKEIVLTGVNTGDFGRSTGEDFLQLIQALDKVEGIERYRISSIEPNLLTDEIIEFCAQSRAFMPHFHIPLQCGSDAVLKLMHRHYDTALFAQKIQRIKEIMPDAFIGVDVIVGMRGETDEYFEEAYNFICELDISQLHVFSYSERPGTKALEIPYVVSPQVKHERSQRLLELSEKKRLAYYERFVGIERPVLWEHSREGEPLQGFTDNYIRVRQNASKEVVDNTISMVKLGGFSEDKECLLQD
uniref:MiaB/RimO family radical SAM methylthiotransferase n=1 Tax=Alloprevotella sp. TaxID=1872471 RepID=UPI0040298084